MKISEKEKKLQMLRLEMNRISIVNYFLQTLTIGLYAWTGSTSWSLIWEFFLASGSTTILFSVMIHLGWNLRFKDKGLLIPQLFVGSTIQIAFLIIAPKLWIVFLVSFVVTYAYAMMRFTPRQFTTGWLIFAIVSGVALYLGRNRFGYPGTSYMDIAILWLYFCFAIRALTLICGQFSNLRDRLSAKNQELSASVERVQQLIAEQKMLTEAEARANQAKSIFLSNMSHELRSPLNAILGFARLLTREPDLSPDGKSGVDIIIRSGEHLYYLINQVLDISKIEAGCTTLNEIDCDIFALLDEVNAMFSLNALQKRLQLTVDSPENLPRYLHIDAGKLRQVLINLVSNAIKFTDKGSVALRVEDCRDGAESKRLTFSVTDTGAGIAEDELQRLGHAFVQAQAGRAAQEGTGLGLAISRNFVQLMGGELQISSTIGQGTTIRFEIDAKTVDLATTGGLVQNQSARVLGIVPGQQTFRILAVDDKAEGRQLLVKLLTPLGFEVKEAENGKEAVALWQTWSPHLILMDLRMPVMSGREATKRIKAEPQGKTTTIVALTASSFEEERAKILSDGYDAYLTKPFNERLLFDVMHQHLDVDFIYEDSEELPKAGLPDPASLAALSVELRERLQIALIHLDIAAIDEILNDVNEQDVSLALALRVLVEDFRYEQLESLLKSIET